MMAIDRTAVEVFDKPTPVYVGKSGIKIHLAYPGKVYTYCGKYFTVRGSDKSSITCARCMEIYEKRRTRP